eukprot:5681290-Pyramimonas_sp.AAC.1
MGPLRARATGGHDGRISGPHSEGPLRAASGPRRAATGSQGEGPRRAAVRHKERKRSWGTKGMTLTGGPSGRIDRAFCVISQEIPSESAIPKYIRWPPCGATRL